MFYVWFFLFLLKFFDMINFILMFLFCCNGKDDGYKLGKNICFFIIMFLSIKDILDEKEKKEL